MKISFIAHLTLQYETMKLGRICGHQSPTEAVPCCRRRDTTSVPLRMLCYVCPTIYQFNYLITSEGLPSSTLIMDAKVYSETLVNIYKRALSRLTGNLNYLLLQFPDICNYNMAFARICILGIVMVCQLVWICVMMNEYNRSWQSMQIGRWYICFEITKWWWWCDNCL
jgi:hypothetical protein